MLAHLTRKRRARMDLRTGKPEYERTTRLRWSGKNAAGDEIDGPVCFVIDVGQKFKIVRRKLYLVESGRSFWPGDLLRAARLGIGGFKVIRGGHRNPQRRGQVAIAEENADH